MNPNCNYISLIQKESRLVFASSTYESELSGSAEPGDLPGQPNLGTSGVSRTWRPPGSAEPGDLPGQPNLEPSWVSRTWRLPGSAEPGDLPGQPNLETSRVSRICRAPRSAEFGYLDQNINHIEEAVIGTQRRTSHNYRFMLLFMHRNTNV